MGFGVGDLFRWSTEGISGRRAMLSILAATLSVVAVASLSGMGASSAAATGFASLSVLAPWITRGEPAFKIPAGAMLALVLAVMAILFSLGSIAAPISGPIADWYSHLGRSFTERVPVDQFVAGIAGAIFLLATANRIVRLVLEAADASITQEDDGPRGGRILGPIERLIIGAAIVTGDLAGAGFVVAAKGLLRFPEIRDAKGSIDKVTEYLLLGTMTSVTIAAAVALIILTSDQ